MTKRKLTHLLLIALAILTMLAFSACGEIPVDGTNDDSTNSENPYIEEEPQGVTWSFDEVTGTLTISGKGDMENYEDLESIPWYEQRENINSIVIKNGVTSIGDCAFVDCSRLTNIDISQSITIIGEGAFGYCKSLTDIHIPDSVTSIGEQAFYGCSGLTSIDIPDRVQSIGDYVFSECNSLTNIEIPDNVTSIGYSAFNDCSSLTSINIPDDVTSIGKDAFYGCSSLKYNEKDGVKYLGNKNNPYVVAVKADRNITSVILPETVKIINGEAFYGCSNLTSIIIPDSVTNIEEFAFGYCKRLTDIHIPDSVTSIHKDAFYDCSSLKYNEKDSIKYLGNKNNPYVVAVEADRNITSVVLPETVKIIGHCAFYDCSSLTSITIPDSVTNIGCGAFQSCSGLTSIDIPDSVTSIDWYAFTGCSRLASITIPDSVKGIGNGAFGGCKGLKNINYSGTKEQWATVNTASIPTDCVVHCTDGDIVTP